MDKPLIGITCVHDHDNSRNWLSLNYIRAVEQGGGLPVPIPLFFMDQNYNILMDKLDAILFTGGGDIDAVHYGEEPLPGQGEVQPERDRIELFMCRRALEFDIPILGICRGAQLLNVAAGGTLYQDIATEGVGVLQHMQNAPSWYPFHRINIIPGSLLFKLANTKTYRVNSFHHQGIKGIAPLFRISARAADGVVEAIESTLYRFVLGVQWHPESMKFDSFSMTIFSKFVEAARNKVD